jgi:ssDNA-binding Zn-finger/Zn-ribbon topoisomerase 1
MKRFEDEHAYKYNYYSILQRGERVAVICPQCGGMALISRHDNISEVRCISCFYVEKESPTYRYKASRVCTECERWFNIKLTDPKQTSHAKIHIQCPHCAVLNQVDVERIPERGYWYSDIRQVREPIFHLELYLQEHVRGKKLWALNMEHLKYLIAYISADLRERPAQGPLRTASHSVPVYLKEAKNRDETLRKLERLLLKAEQAENRT